MAEGGGARDPLRTAAQPFGWLSALALASMVLGTTADVAIRGVFNLLIRIFGPDAVYPYMFSIPGTVDLMEMALTVCVFLALPGVFLRDENITVDLIDGLGRPGLTFALKLTGLALGLGFLGLSLTQMIDPALDRFQSGEGTMTLQLPRWWQAIPIMLGFGCSALAVFFVAARVLRRGPGAALGPTRSAVD